MSDHLAEFTFEQCLGKGGFGEVYLATLRRPGGLDKRVAVKILKEGLRNEGEAVKRLRDEGRMLATLNHPAILYVHDLWRIAGRIALVTEYVEGIDLSRCCKPDRLLPPRVVLGAMGGIADALHVAWSTPSPETGRPLQLVHRDVKPENIRVGVHGQVKLLDFGIARTTEIFRHAKTALGELPFTPGYAPPEAFLRGVQGPSGDIYALGVSTYRLLAGERFYQKLPLEEQVSIATDEERYREWMDERLGILRVPEEVLALLRSLLAHDREDRPTAAAAREAFEEVADALAGPTLARWVRRVRFPPPREVAGASLTGRTIPEEPLEAASARGAAPSSGGATFDEPDSPDGPVRQASTWSDDGTPEISTPTPPWFAAEPSQPPARAAPAPTPSLPPPPAASASPARAPSASLPPPPAGIRSLTPAAAPPRAGGPPSVPPPVPDVLRSIRPTTEPIPRPSGPARRPAAPVSLPPRTATPEPALPATAAPIPERPQPPPSRKLPYLALLVGAALLLVGATLVLLVVLYALV